MTGKPNVGRPSEYTPEIADRICEAIATGGALYRLCDENAEWPSEATVYVWLGKYPEFQEKYARARERQADRQADEIVTIADEATDANIARVRIDARKWKASKLSPKKYGDRVTNKVVGDDDDGPVKHEMAASPYLDSILKSIGVLKDKAST